MTPTARSIQKLRDEGWLVERVEQWNSYTKTRKDCFGFADLLCCRGDVVMLVQVTSGSNVSARVAKINETPASRFWLRPPTRKIVVQGWRKAGPRGKRKTWQCREVEIV